MKPEKDLQELLTSPSGHIDAYDIPIFIVKADLLRRGEITPDDARIVRSACRKSAHRSASWRANVPSALLPLLVSVA